MKRHIGHCIKLLCNENFRKDIKKLRSVCLKYYKDTYSELNIKGPENFTNKDITYLWSDEITGLSDDLTFISEDRPLSVIAGYKVEHKNEITYVYLNCLKLSDQTISFILAMIDRYNFDFGFVPLNYFSNDLNLMDIFFIMGSPLYFFISACVVFNMDSIRGSNLEKLIPAARYWIRDYKSDLIEGYISKFKLDKIYDLLKNDDITSEGILNELNSTSFIKKVGDFRKKAEKYSPVLAFPGVLPAKSEWDEIWAVENEHGNAEPDRGMDYITAYDSYLRKKLTKKTYEELAEEHGIAVRTFKRKIYKLIERLEIPYP